MGGQEAKYLAFFIGLIVGLMLCSILMSCVGSAVNTVIVLFADAPAEFEENYPQLSEKMRTAYRDAHYCTFYYTKICRREGKKSGRKFVRLRACDVPFSSVFA